MTDETLNRLTKIHNKINAILPFACIFVSIQKKQQKNAKKKKTTNDRVERQQCGPRTNASYHIIRRTRVVYLFCVFILISCRLNAKKTQTKKKRGRERKINFQSISSRRLFVRANKSLSIYYRLCISRNILWLRNSTLNCLDLHVACVRCGRNVHVAK